MKHLYLIAILVLSAVWHQRSFAQNNEQPFKAFERALVNKPERDYNADQYAIELSRKNIPNVLSEMIPIEQGRFIKLEVYAHYSRSDRSRIFRKAAQVAIGAGIASIPYLINEPFEEEPSIDNSYGKTLLPIAGALVVADAFRRNQRTVPNIGALPNRPIYRNGLFVPKASMQYTFYNNKRSKVKTVIIDIDRQAKDQWQKLIIQDEIEQDGFYTVELINTNANPVYFDSFNMLLFEASLYHEVAKQKSAFPALDDEGNLGIAGINDFEVNIEDIDQAITNITNSNKTNARTIVTTCTWTCWTSDYSSGCTVPKCSDSEVKNDGNGVIPENQKPYLPPSQGGIPTRRHNSIGSATTISDSRLSSNPTKPGTIDWASRTPTQIIAHFLRAQWYCREKRIKFKYSDYFYNMPKAGSTGFGGYIEVKGDIKVRGQQLSVTIIVPLMTANQVFDPIFHEGKSLQDYNNCNFRYGCTQGNFYFGDGNSRNNVTEVYVSGSNYSFMYDFFTGAPQRTGPTGGGGSGGGPGDGPGRDPRSVNNDSPSKPIEVTTSPITAEGENNQQY